MKQLLIAIVLFNGWLNPARSQEKDIVTGTTVSIEGVLQPALTISFHSHDDDVEDVLKEEIKHNDGKVRSSHGLIIGRGIRIKQIADKDRDIYWKLESKGRKKKEIVTVTMAVQNPDGGFLSDSAHTDAYTNAYAWLSALPGKVAVYQKDQELTELRKQLKKVTNDLNDLQGSTTEHRREVSKKSKELKELEKKIDNLQKQNR